MPPATGQQQTIMSSTKQNMRKGGGAVGSKAMRKNRGGGKSGRVMGKYKGRGGPPATLATLDLSCILDPVVVDGGNGSEKSCGGEVKWRDDDEEEEEVGEKPFTRKGGLYLSGGRTVTRDSHLLREFHITAIINAADNVHYSTVEGTLLSSLRLLPLTIWSLSPKLAWPNALCRSARLPAPPPASPRLGCQRHAGPTRCAAGVGVHRSRAGEGMRSCALSRRRQQVGGAVACARARGAVKD